MCRYYIECLMLNSIPVFVFNPDYGQFSNNPVVITGILKTHIIYFSTKENEISFLIHNTSGELELKIYLKFLTL